MNPLQRNADPEHKMIPLANRGIADMDEIQSAFAAVHAGQGTPYQQMYVLRVIDQLICGVDGQSFIPGHPDLTQFYEGQRWVGREIRRLCVPKGPRKEPADE